MNDRFVEIDNFLKDFDTIYSQNPSLEINSNSLYFYLARYGLSPEEMKDRDISDNFSKWIERNKNKPNLDVFWSERQSAFLQFHNNKNPGKEYKIYLSFHKDNIYECVNRVFDFMAENNVVHFSKVANKVRADDVVLRVTNEDDMFKVMNFVNNDPMLVAAAKPRNPFMMQHGIASFSYDDMLSFNSTLSLVLEEYFKSCRKENLLGKSVVSVEHLRNYAYKFYSDIFVNHDKLEDFNKKVCVKGNSRSSEGTLLNNYEQVLRLIVFSLNEDFTLNNYASFVNYCRDSSLNKKLIDKYDNILNEKRNSRDNHSPDMRVKKQILDSYIVFAETLYGKEGIAVYLKSYLAGSTKAITRQNNFRNVFSSSITPEDVLSISNGNIDSYINSIILNKSNTSNNNVATGDDIISNSSLFYEACLATYEKYGFEHLYSGVVCALKGDFKYFTNGEKMYRKNLINSFKASDIKRICIDYISKLDIDISKYKDPYLLFCDLITANYENEKKIDEEKNKNSSVR